MWEIDAIKFDRLNISCMAFWWYFDKWDRKRSMAPTSGGGTDDCRMAIKSLSACRCMNLREAVFGVGFDSLAKINGWYGEIKPTFWDDQWRRKNLNLDTLEVALGDQFTELGLTRQESTTDTLKLLLGWLNWRYVYILLYNIMYVLMIPFILYMYPLGHIIYVSTWTYYICIHLDITNESKELQRYSQWGSSWLWPQAFLIFADVLSKSRCIRCSSRSSSSCEFMRFLSQGP